MKPRPDAQPDDGEVQGDSALVVEIPSAEPVVADWRAVHDPVANRGMPAHVTVLYPFRPAQSIDANVLAAALDVIGDHQPFTVRFADVGTFGGGVVWLRPDPSAPFIRITESLVESFADCKPYGGRFREPVPHLTIAKGVADSVDSLVDEARAALGRDPIQFEVIAVSLFTRGTTGGWTRRASIPLGTAPAGG